MIENLFNKIFYVLKQNPAGSSGDAFVILLEWTVKDILKPSFERGKHLDAVLRAQILDNCQKVIVSVAIPCLHRNFCS